MKMLEENTGPGEKRGFGRLTQRWIYGVVEKLGL